MSWRILAILAVVATVVGFLGGVYLLPGKIGGPAYSGPLLRRAVEYGFAADSRDVAMLQAGWHPPSRECTWSTGRGSIALKQIGSGPGGIRLALTADGLVNDKRPKQDIELYVGSLRVAQWSWAKGGTRQEVTAHVPQRLLTSDGDVTLTIVDTNVKSIRDLGLGEGTLPHGICLVKIVASPV